MTRVFSNFVGFMPIHWKCEMWASFPSLILRRPRSFAVPNDLGRLRIRLEFPRSWFLGDRTGLERERKNRPSLFTFSIKREIRHFHLIVVQWQQRNVQKSVMHVQSCCFANWTYCFFAVVVAVGVVVVKAPFSRRSSPTTQDSLCGPTHAKRSSQDITTSFASSLVFAPQWSLRTGNNKRRKTNLPTKRRNFTGTFLQRTNIKYSSIPDNRNNTQKRDSSGAS